MSNKYSTIYVDLQSHICVVTRALENRKPIAPVFKWRWDFVPFSAQRSWKWYVMRYDDKMSHKCPATMGQTAARLKNYEHGPHFILFHYSLYVFYPSIQGYFTGTGIHFESKKYSEYDNNKTKQISTMCTLHGISSNCRWRNRSSHSPWRRPIVV